MITLHVEWRLPPKDNNRGGNGEEKKRGRPRMPSLDWIMYYRHYSVIKYLYSAPSNYLWWK